VSVVEVVTTGGTLTPADGGGGGGEDNGGTTIDMDSKGVDAVGEVVGVVVRRSGTLLDAMFL